MLLISYRLIFKFSHKRDSNANNFSNFSHPPQNLYLSKPLLSKECFKMKENIFLQNLNSALSVIQFLATILFKFRKNSSLSTI